MNKRILLIRTFKHQAAGGPIPPLGLLYIASSIIKYFGNAYEIKILDTGIRNLLLDEIKEEIRQFSPSVVGLSALTCEATLMHKIAEVARNVNKGATIVVGGPHATVAYQYLLRDKNIDYAVLGEAEYTIVGFLKMLHYGGDIHQVKGVAYRRDDEIILTEQTQFTENLDAIPFPAWSLIDINEYAQSHNWNGILKEKYYMPIITSRGCPFRCSFCHNIFGKELRVRSPENVFSEILALYNEYRVREIHIIDDVFNFDAERAKKICSLIIDSGIKVSLAFPNGLRADIMSNELLSLLRKAGTYKINYAIETSSKRIQRMINKNLDIHRAEEVIEMTAKKGIITAGYFMLGFPTETLQEMKDTINLAVRSHLDNAYFFKVTSYPGTELYQSIAGPNQYCSRENENFDDFHFYSVQRSCSEISVPRLNELILQAQQRFYLNPKRIWRLMVKSLNKREFFKNFISMLGLIVQSYLIRKLGGKYIHNS